MSRSVEKHTSTHLLADMDDTSSLRRSSNARDREELDTAGEEIAVLRNARSTDDELLLAQ